MKRRPIFVFVAFLAAVALVALVGRAAVRGEEAPLRREIEELQRCGHRRHLDAAAYASYAGQARREQARQAAGLFEAMARSARLQERYCALAVTRLGGSYAAPPESVPEPQGADADLAQALRSGREGLAGVRYEGIVRMMEAGNRYAARVLIWVAAGEMRNLVLLEQCASCGGASCIYLVCPTCGVICDQDHCDLFCPVCLTDSRRFERVE